MKPRLRASWGSVGTFKNDETVRLCVRSADGHRDKFRPGTPADFVISARHARGLWTLWRTVQTLRDIGRDNEGWMVEWKLADWEQMDRWAFADFRFDAIIRDGTQTHRVRSDVRQHFASTVGFYGFGPVGERWSNAEIRRIAREAGGVAIGARDAVALRRLARCVPPGEPGMRVYGYSLGGRAAVRFARWLERRGISVDVLVGIDPVDLAARTLVVPPNVRRAVSFYQRNGARLPLLIGPAGRGLTFAAASANTAVENHRVEEWVGGGRSLPATHENMPCAVKTEVIARLQRV